MVPPEGVALPVLIVNLSLAGEHIMATGICEDVTLFRHAHFLNTLQAHRYLSNRFGNQFRLVINNPPKGSL